MKSTLSVLLFILCAVPAGHAQEALTGNYRLSLTSSEIVDAQTAEALADIVDPAETLDWQVYVPEMYTPARPPGVVIFFDPRGWGGLPDQWRQVINDSNLIWVGPKKNEARPSMDKKVWSAVLGLRAIEQHYTIDLNRVYIASLEDEAVTAINTQLYANEIRGAIYMRGSVFWTSIEPDRLEALKRKRHVFMSGTNDRRKSDVRGDYERYQRAGIHNVKLIFATRTPLGNPPEPEYLAEAIRYLDDY